MSKFWTAMGLLGAGGWVLAAGPGFVEVPAARSGVDFGHSFDEKAARADLYHSGFACGGVCIGDVNGDGRPDLYFSDGAKENALYLNEGAMKFAKQTGTSLGGGAFWGTGANLVDIDSDGDLDLCQVNFDAPVQFFLNDGKGVFKEVAGAFGLGVTDASLAMSFADVDGDGDLDAYLLCNEYYRAEGRPDNVPYEMRDGVPVVDEEFRKYYHVFKDSKGRWKMDNYGREDYLFLNEGTRTRPKFVDVSKEAGVRQKGHALSCVWLDYDSDGDLDLFVANDFMVPDRFYRNDGVKDGIPRFVDVAAEVLPAVSWSSMGSDVSDLNNDGRPDLMVVDMSATSHFKAKLNMGEMTGAQREVLENGWPRQAMRNHLYIHNGTDFYSESAFASGVASTDWSWAPKLADFDNDGLVDVFVTNGITRNFTDSDHNRRLGDINAAQVGRSMWSLYQDLEPMREANLAYRNVDGKRFEPVTEAWGLGLAGMSYNAAYGDLDGDGDLDLVVSDLGKPSRIYENRLAKGNGLIVRLEGARSNRMGIGARVTVFDTGGRGKTRWMMPWTGFQSQNEPMMHFGLGKARPEKVVVDWFYKVERGGVTARRDEVEVGVDETSVTVREEDRATKHWDSLAGSWFVEEGKDRGIDFEHEERPFTDFIRQPLLPGRLSQLAAPVAVGDVDGDGDEDLFTGGAAYQDSELFLNEGGTFKRLSPSPFAKDRSRECMDALWFDADGDGDLDLYVVSGSVESSRLDPLYRDSLYLNRSEVGKVVLEKAVQSLPDLADSGSCARAADYDGDGDLDLFVGSRSVVGYYPVSPRSRLLRNDSADGKVRFVEVTEEVAPDLLRAGMVTAAEWTDVDRDGDADLMTAAEWGPVRLFRNEGGKLMQVTEGTDLLKRIGWWSALAAEDVDGDGDEDYLLGNVGWNTKYGIASSKKPATLYYGDMDGSGERRLVEAKNAEERLLPVRGKSCSTHAIPSLGKKFGSFREFAVCDLVGIYSEERLAKAAKYQADCFESGVLLNETPKGGAPSFRWAAFPWEAQLSPVNDFAIAELDGKDGLEVVGAQNHFTREPETGLWRGNPGFVLRWNGQGFETVSPRTTGLVLPGDTKSVVAGDFDGDGRTEVVAGQNNGSLLFFGRR